MAQFIIRPDEPTKLLRLFSKLTGKDMSALQEKLKDLTISGPGITLTEKIDDNTSLILQITIAQ